MPRFAANISMLFTEVPLLERIDRAAASGFEAIEIQCPYEAPASDIRARLDANNLKMILHNLPAGDWSKGDRGIACDRSRQSEFREGIDRAIEYADALAVTRLNCLAGVPRDGTDDATARGVFLENLAFAAEKLQKSGISLLIEPLNSRDVPGFWLDGVAKALSILDELNSENVLLLFDVYHAQRSGGEIAGTLTANIDRIGHIQIADNPGRHEPGTGELYFPYLFRLIDETGYNGWVGAEYKPTSVTEAGLKWFRAYRSVA